MLKLKETLLARGFKDNSFLDEYVELMLNNHGVPLKKGSTQKHHVIPVSSYNNTITETTSQRAALLRVANSDSDNYKVNLNYPDHIKAHWLLCQCSPNIVQKIHNTNAYLLMLRTLLPAIAAGVVQDLETYEDQQSAYEYIRSNTPPASGAFKEREGFYAPPPRARHKANTKIRCIETGIVYDSMRAAEMANGLAKSRLNSILTGHRKQIPGMTFEYYSETNEISEVSE